MLSKLISLLRRRLVGATGYSLAGLRACFQHEEAFRFEVTLGLLLSPLALIIADSVLELVLLFGSILLVLITELLNSAVESVVDLVSPEKTELAGRAKDQGSAAVMLSLGLFVLVWGGVAVRHFYYR